MHILLLWWDDVWAAQAADDFPRSQAIATEADSDDYWLYILRKDSRCFTGETLELLKRSSTHDCTFITIERRWPIYHHGDGRRRLYPTHIGYRPIQLVSNYIYTYVYIVDRKLQERLSVMEISLKMLVRNAFCSRFCFQPVSSLHPITHSVSVYKFYSLFMLRLFMLWIVNTFAAGFKRLIGLFAEVCAIFRVQAYIYKGGLYGTP